ncbi:MAG: bacteriocin [Eubacteriales bacterium]|nr:bacteriocin [Eubacteriales bacterium]
MKTPEELNALKEEVADMKKKLSELTDEELSLVTGGETGWMLGSQKPLVISPDYQGF